MWSQEKWIPFAQSPNLYLYCDLLYYLRGSFPFIGTLHIVYHKLGNLGVAVDDKP